jgi:hypothetical protein
VFVLRGEHPNGCRGDYPEPTKGYMGAQMEHELAHHCVLGKPIYFDVHQFVALEACLPRLLPLAAEQFVPHS